MCVSRVWRDIVARVQMGYGHGTEKPVTPGSLAIFCPACPQPGINLPDGWENDKQRWAMFHLLYLFSDSSATVGYILGAL